MIDRAFSGSEETSGAVRKFFRENGEFIAKMVVVGGVILAAIFWWLSTMDPDPHGYRHFVR